MKKLIYIILILAELFVGVLLMYSMWMSTLYVPFFATLAVVLGFLTWQILKFVKTEDEAKRQKIKLNIFLIMMLPVVVFFFTYVVIAIIMAFAM